MVLCACTSSDLHLQLQADAELLVVDAHGIEVLVEIENHHARVEVLDDVVEVDLGRFLRVVDVDRIEPIRVVGFRELAEQFELARSARGRRPTRGGP